MHARFGPLVLAWGMTCLGAPVLLCAQSAATVAIAPKMVTLAGSVFDSTMNQRMANVQVWVPGTASVTVSDSSGSFLLADVPAGKQTIAFSSPVFDSLGIGTRTITVEVKESNNARLELSAPTAGTLWKALCARRQKAGTDSGIVWGSVFHAESRTLLREASVFFAWAGTRTAGVNGSTEDARAEVLTDSTGQYFACGVPTDATLAMRALGDSAASGEIQLRLGRRMLQRLDLSVSADLYNQAVAPAGADTKPKGRATLNGSVFDEYGNPIAGAQIAISAIDTVVRTGSDGNFSIAAMPSGTLTIIARGIGHSSVAKQVDLRSGTTVELNLMLIRTTVLTTVDVNAPVRKIPIDEAEFLERRKLAIGGLVVDMSGRRYAEAVGPLRNIPRVQVTSNREGPIVTMTRPGAGRSCIPRIYLNGNLIAGGRLTRDSSLTMASGARSIQSRGTQLNNAAEAASASALTEINADELTVVEVYTNWTQVPARYLGPLSDNPCGVILYWTRFTIPK